MRRRKQIECSSEDGITVGLIDSIMSIAKVLGPRLKPTKENVETFELSKSVKEALKDLHADRNLLGITLKAFSESGEKIKIS